MNKKYLTVEKYVIIFFIVVIVSIGAFYKYKARQEFYSQSKFFSASQVSPNDVIITITDTKVEPAEITIKVGQKVTFVNKSLDFAWPASNPHPTHTDYPEFDPREPLDVNEAWTFTFTRPGDWKHHDHLKPSRRGLIKVTE